MGRSLRGPIFCHASEQPAAGASILDLVGTLSSLASLPDAQPVDSLLYCRTSEIPGRVAVPCTNARKDARLCIFCGLHCGRCWGCRLWRSFSGNRVSEGPRATPLPHFTLKRPFRQVHIALAGKNGMRVAYFTPNATTSTQCAYGTTPTGLASLATGSASNYLPNAGLHHTVKLANLTEGSTYYYACGDGSAENTSATFSFVQPTSAAPTTGQSFGTLIFGDMGWLDSKRAGGPMLPVGGLDTNWSATLTRELSACRGGAGALKCSL